MQRHINNARKSLADLGALGAQTEADEKRILENATKRRDELAGFIERSRPGIEAANDAMQQRYTDAVSEVGQLEIVIGKARKALQMQ